MGNVAMCITTEELSRGSLAAAGSLITRPEILTKALLAGGTEAQKLHWLPKLASGELMVGISVTEPDVGSDVASVKFATGCNAPDQATKDEIMGVIMQRVPGLKAVEEIKDEPGRAFIGLDTIRVGPA